MSADEPGVVRRRPMDEPTRVLLGDVEAQALRIRQHWALMDDAARLAAVNELNCRSQELYAVVDAAPEPPGETT